MVSCKTVDVLCILLLALTLMITVTIVPVKTTPITRYAALDLYTHQPDGSNGRGFNQSSDPVDPGSYVTFYANVTYFSWPEQGKDVSFQILDPNGDIASIFFNKTDEMGIAYVSFQLPWNPDDPPHHLGIWEATATVTVAETIVSDYLTFRVRVLGDLNDDGCVDIFDIILLTHAYMSRPGDPNWNERADFNNDGVVDINDMVILTNEYGTCF